MHTFVRLLAAVLALLALAACGSGGSSALGEPAASETTAAAPAASEPTAGGEAAAAQTADVEATAAATRTIVHDQGDTEVPVDPQRVVTLDSPHLDAALALGVTPVGAVSSPVDDGLPAYLGDRVDGVELVGTIEEPDLEAIAALQPDLILSATVRHEGIYDRLTQIAPTVFTASSGTDWREGFTLVADALGRVEEGQAALAAHDERVAALGEELGAQGRRVAIMRFLPDETRIYGPDTFSGSVLNDIGFDLPDLDYDEYSMAYISAEQVQLVEDAEAIFATTYGDPDETTRGAVSSLWGTLPAVQAGCQFDVEDGEWMIGIGLIGAQIILDDVEAALGGGAC